MSDEAPTAGERGSSATSRSSVTIGFLARERFAVAPESLASLYEHTSQPFTLLVVDAGTPPHVLSEMRDVLAPHDNWRILHHDGPLLPAAAKNLLLREIDAATEYVCFLENDNLFSDGWLDALVDACERVPADVAAPLIREGRGDAAHFDRNLGSVVSTADGRWEVRRLERPREETEHTERIEFVEQHCVLFRRSVFDRIGPYDEELNTRDEVDVSLALRHAGAVVVLEPRAIINYVAPTAPPEPDELEFYRLRWDLDRAVASRERIRERWNLVETPGDLGFVRYRNLIPELPRVRDTLADLTRGGRRVTLIDDGDWIDTKVTRGLGVDPFPDVGGHFGGFPSDGAEAVAELARVVDAGADHIVVGWPARWWFEHLPELERALHEWAGVVREDGVLLIFSRELAGGDR